ncbi:7,8-dihydro-8-oxoguanine triphosphatase isoform X2 [Aplysia californica]|uniref:Oxidized purine nucleoside triphosphate hydrolase n=1 Tax=Aplysia californica TaxID=6500 RepID=A0ABM0K5I6_APLCA|nr:7,8-dihydro-8-oxoguanine triphosphatase isoform X2 [Aplysia californica]
MERALSTEEIKKERHQENEKALRDKLMSSSHQSSMAMKKVLTLVFVREPGRILLGMKKRGFGQGRWNGFGGKVEKGESITDGAKRELLEECGVTAKSLNEVGLINFEFVGDPVILEVHVFDTWDYMNSPVETEEMRPQWYGEKEVPFGEMWPDDEYWFPHMLNGKKFEAYYKFEGMDKILDSWIKEKTEQTS